MLIHGFRFPGLSTFLAACLLLFGGCGNEDPSEPDGQTEDNYSPGEIQWSSLGPPGGSVGTVRFHPQDSNKIYLELENDLYKSTDGGNTWSESGWKDAAWDFPYILSVQVGGGSHPPLFILGSAGVWRSRDEGANWKMVLPLEFASHLKRQGAGALLTAKGDEILQSVDNGETWSSTVLPQLSENLTLSVRDITASVSGTLVALVDQCFSGCDHGPQVLFRSFDGGQSWSLRTLSESLEPFYGLIPGRQPETLLAQGQSGIWRSPDLGASWSLVESNLRDLSFVSRLESGKLAFFSGQELWISQNDGLSWQMQGDSFPVPWPGSLVEFPGAPERYLAGTAEAGAYQSNDSGKTWSPIRSLGGSVPIRAVNFFSRKSDSLFIQSTGGQFLFSPDAGANWEWLLPNTLEERSNLVIAESSPPVLYQAFSEGEQSVCLYKSLDLGRSWMKLGFCPSTSSLHLASDPAQPETLYVLQVYEDPEVLQVSRNAGESFERLSLPRGFYLDFFALAPGSSQFAPWDLLVAMDQGPNEGLGLFRASGQEGQWELFSKNFQTIWAIAVDPQRQARLVVDAEEQLFEAFFYLSLDAGRTWELLPTTGLPGLPGAKGQSLLPDPIEENGLFLLAEGNPSNQVFYSTSAGDSWNQLPGDLPDNHRSFHGIIRDFQAHPGSGELFVATEQGLYRGVRTEQP